VYGSEQRIATIVEYDLLMISAIREVERKSRSVGLSRARTSPSLVRDQH